MHMMPLFHAASHSHIYDDMNVYARGTLVSSYIHASLITSIYIYALYDDAIIHIHVTWGIRSSVFG